MTGYDYNQLLSVFYISYIVFEIPATVLCKHIGPGSSITPHSPQISSQR